MFDTYPQAVLAEPTHSAANARSLEALGCGIPQQSFALGRAIQEGISIRKRDGRIFETHPELVFMNLAGHLPPKKSWSGLMRRVQTLESSGVILPRDFPVLDDAACDDIVDAAAAALAADRIALGIARKVPFTGEGFPIWF